MYIARFSIKLFTRSCISGTSNKVLKNLKVRELVWLENVWTKRIHTQALRNFYLRYHEKTLAPMLFFLDIEKDYFSHMNYPVSPCHRFDSI